MGSCNFQSAVNFANLSPWLVRFASNELLVREKRITVTLGERMMKMVGFRNIAVHQYRRLSPEIVTAVIDSKLDELLEFCDQVRKLLNR